LETRYACGLVRAGCNARRRHDEKEEPIAAFSTIDRSITEMIGAIKAEALAAEVRSAASLRPRLEVFH